MQQAILVFKNDGPRIVSEMWGDVRVLDSQGSETMDSFPHRCLFAAEDSSPVQPGETREWQIVSLGGIRAGQPADSAIVKITEAWEHSTQY